MAVVIIIVQAFLDPVACFVLFLIAINVSPNYLYKKCINTSKENLHVSMGLINS